MRTSPYFDQEPAEVPVIGIIADEDKSQPYELDALAVYKVIGKGYLVVYVSGCSCWPDRGSTSQRICHNKTDVQKALREFGYESLMDKLQQASWKVEKHD